MEILFENIIERNKQMAKEIYRYFYFQRTAMAAGYAVLILCFISNLLRLFFEGYCSWFVMLAVPLLFLFQFYIYSKQVKTMVTRDREVFEKGIIIKNMVYEDRVQMVSSTGSDISIDFAKVTKVILTKNLILLRTKANQLIIFGKESFTVGTKEEFVRFLSSKGYKVRFK